MFLMVLAHPGIPDEGPLRSCCCVVYASC